MKISTRSHYRGFQLSTYFDGTAWTAYAVDSGQVLQAPGNSQEEALERVRAEADRLRPHAPAEPPAAGADAPGGGPTGLALYDPKAKAD